MAGRGPAGRSGAGGRFAQFKLVLLGTCEAHSASCDKTNMVSGESAVGKVLLCCHPSHVQLSTNPPIVVLVSLAIRQRPV